MTGVDFGQYPEIQAPLRHLAAFGFLEADDTQKLIRAIASLIERLEGYEDSEVSGAWEPVS